MQKFKSIFRKEKPILGVIHIKALPGTPKNTLSSSQIIHEAMKEARVYKTAGIDALIIENMHDNPYLNSSVGPEITALMSLIGYLVKEETMLPVGIQILAGANIEALAVAKASGLDFIRAEGFVFAHVADEGIINAQAGELLRYRKQINASEVAIYTDIKKKHSSHKITQDVSLLETAEAARFFLSDGVIITGSHTGKAADVEQLKKLKTNLNFPIFVGSGITLDNVSSYLPVCDAMIVGSYFKEKGYWKNTLSYERIAKFMEQVRLL